MAHLPQALMRVKHVVITGAGGFVGQRLARRLLSEPTFAGADFTLTDFAIPEAPKAGNVRIVEGDLCDQGFLAEILATRADVVFAATIHAA